MVNVLLKKEYPEQYTSDVSTRVSNALLIGEVIGMLVIGYFSLYLYTTGIPYTKYTGVG